MKKILHVVNVFFVLPYFIGEQFDYFKKAGYKMHVICSPSPLLENYSVKMGFRFKAIPILKAISPLTDLIAAFKICSYIRKNKIDIVVGHTPKGSLLSMFAARIMRVPARIYFRHGLVYETMSGIKRAMMICADRFTAACATRVVCVSHSVARRSIEDRLNSPGKQQVLLNGTCGGIDTINKFNPERLDIKNIEMLKHDLGIGPDTFVIGYVGRLVKDKGTIELLDSFDLLRKRHPDINLRMLLVGGFEKRDCLPQLLIERIRNDSYIINTGFIFEGIENYYSLMDVVVLPSYREGFGMSVIEASAMKKPVLTTRVTGCEDSILEDKTGKFIELTAQSICEGVEFFFDKTEAEAYGSNGRSFVTQYFEQQLIWPEIEKLYL